MVNSLGESRGLALDRWVYMSNLTYGLISGGFLYQLMGGVALNHLWA
jgi:hypothetical protein